MLGRIRDIIYLLIFGYTSTERRCRVLEADLHSIFEKLNLLMAREAKRESRQARARLAELELEPATPTGSTDRKAAIRARLFGHVRPPLTREVMSDEPTDQSSESAG